MATYTVVCNVNAGKQAFTPSTFIFTKDPQLEKYKQSISINKEERVLFHGGYKCLLLPVQGINDTLTRRFINKLQPLDT